MTDEPTSGGQQPETPRRDVLRQNVEIDVSNLSDEQVVELRRRLAEFAKGIQDLAGDFGIGLAIVSPR